MREKTSLERNYSVFAVIVLLVVYTIAYFVGSRGSAVYPTMVAMGFVIFLIIFLLLLVALFEGVSKNRLDYLNKVLGFCFINLLGECVAFIFSFFFYTALMGSFDIVEGSLIIFQPVSFVILSVFNHLHYQNKRVIGVFAVVGVVFLSIGLLSVYNRLFLVSTAVSLMLFSAVAYRVFKVEIPKEMNR